MNLLDFSSHLTKSDYTAYASMHNKENICVVPRNLGIRSTADGIPFFYLEAVRGITPFSKPSPYGMLQLQLSPSDITTNTIAEIQEKWPAATPQTPDFSLGYLGLQMIADEGEDVLDELEAPVKMTNLPFSRFRFVRRISMDYLKLIKDALQKGVLLFKGFGVCSVKGYAPKVPVTLEFEPEALSRSLLDEFANDGKRIPVSIISGFFEKPLEELPFIIKSKEETNSEQLQACLTDWYCNRFCTVAPPMATDDEVFFELNEDALSIGNFSWDLLEDIVVERHTHFTFNALKEAFDMVKEKGIDTLFTTTVVEPLHTGFLRVEIFHPFDQIPLGIRQIGVKLSAMPNPPERNRAINETVVFDNGQDKKIATLHFSAKEEQEYEVTPFTIYGDNLNTKEVLGTITKVTGQELNVTQDNFPFIFRSLSCSPNLFSQASLTLLVKKRETEEPIFDPVVLDSENPNTMFALLGENTEELICQVVTKSLTTEEVITTSFPLLSDKKIDLTSFKEYGSHQVTIKYETSGHKIIGLDLVPEYLEPNTTNTTTVALSADQDQTWQWFVPSIFKSGFKYRLHEEQPSWSEIQSPFTETLVLKKTVMNKQQHFEDISYYPNATKKGSYNYYPIMAMPQLDGNGDPMTSVMGGGDNWILLVSTKYHVPEERIEALARDLIKQDLIKSSSDLSLAKLEVENVELVLTSASDKIVLGTSKSSGHNPFSAVFNSIITEDKQKQVVAAFHGQKDILQVDYHVTLTKTYAVDMALKGDIHEASTSLNTESSREDIKGWLEAQIKNGMIELISQFDDAVPEHFIKEVHEKLLNKVISEIQMGLDPLEMTPDTSILEVKMKEEIPITEEFVASTDISTWFQNNPNDYIKIIA